MFRTVSQRPSVSPTVPINEGPPGFTPTGRRPLHVGDLSIDALPPRYPARAVASAEYLRHLERCAVAVPQVRDERRLACGLREDPSDRQEHRGAPVIPGAVMGVGVVLATRHGRGRSTTAADNAWPDAIWVGNGTTSAVSACRDQTPLMKVNRGW